MPVMTPDVDPIVATEVLELAHVPVGELASVIVLPTHT